MALTIRVVIEDTDTRERVKSWVLDNVGDDDLAAAIEVVDPILDFSFSATGVEPMAETVDG